MNSSPSQNTEENGLVLAIKEKQVSVPPEGSVEIHVAAINQGTEEVYLDILVKGVPSEWTNIETPVVHLSPEETKQFTITVQPPAISQNRIGRYPLDIQAVSQSDPKRSATAHSFITVAAYESRGRIGVILGSIYFSISPGSSINIPILLQNRGSEEDSFGLNIEGIPARWISANAAFTELEPNKSKEILLTIRVPRSPEASAGRMPFTIKFTSQKSPDQKTEVECILTVSVFSEFSASLQPETLQSGQTGNLIIDNQGNTNDTYRLNFISSGDVLNFEKGIPVSTTQSQSGDKEVELGYVEIPQGEKFRVAAGKRGIYPFRIKLRAHPIFGNERIYPYTIQVQSTEDKSTELPGKATENGLLPVWLIPASLIGLLILVCGILLLFPISNLRNSARSTQTAVANLTQTALLGQEDTDGDGLINSEELAIETDPLTADTDGDVLLDGEEVIAYMTNPLVPDTDGDGLLDGEEVQVYMTNPLSPDTDADSLNDGAERDNGTNPLIPDTDQDGMSDGVEINTGTDPLQQDTDKDGLLDGQENQTCPRPLLPDSDGDGIIDGNDLNPCDLTNPSLTATAIAGTAQVTAAAPTFTPVGTLAPTNPVIATPTLNLPNLGGNMVFESNRNGNSEIYALNLENQSIMRLTENSAADTQPALAPDLLRVAYVSNQSGNNEIFVTGLDRRVPVNLTNNPGDDQEPAWSPSGEWIVFTSNRDGNQEIYTMRSNGTEVHNLTNNLANDFAPTWFSVQRLLGTEEWIAFTSTRDGNLEIYKVRPDGTDLVNITKNTANDYSPSGLADLALLTFVTDRDGNPEIFMMTDTGGAPTNVTKNGAQDIEPALGRNGEWIIFTSDRDGNLEVYLIELVSGNIYNVTRNTSQDRHPDW
jgi:TolB protein